MRPTRLGFVHKGPPTASTAGANAGRAVVTADRRRLLSGVRTATKERRAAVRRSVSLAARIASKYAPTGVILKIVMVWLP
ncbi:MAG TPA: hypothetical protein VGA77_09965 [Propylenella sp.]